LSKHSGSYDIVVEWSNREVTVFDKSSRRTEHYAAGETLPYSGKTALLAISRRSVFVRAARVPNAAPEDVRMVVQIKLTELFPVPPTDLAFDFFLLNDLNVEGRLALIVAMPVTELKKAFQTLASSGIKVGRTVPVALGSALLAESLGRHDAAIVERTGDLASVDLVVEGVLRYSRVVAPGTPLEVEVSRTYNAAGLPCSAIIAAGSAEVGDADTTTSNTALASLADVAGEKLRIDLTLPEVLAAREAAAKRWRQTFAALVFAVAVGIAGTTVMDYQDAVSKVASTKRLNATKLKPYDADSANSKALLARNQDIATTLKTAFKPAQTIYDMTTLAANLAPAGVWLTGLSLERGKEMTIRGTATSNDAIVQYTDDLNNESQGRFRNARLTFATNAAIEKIPVVQFNITLFPVGNLPIALQQKAGS